jgi:hypothetical protein
MPRDPKLRRRCGGYFEITLLLTLTTWNDRGRAGRSAAKGVL